jgi:transposase InsO family protein
VKYQTVNVLHKKYGVSILCAYLGCSRSGYYDWIHRGKPKRNKLDEERATAVMTVYLEKPTRGRRQVQMLIERQYGIHMSLGSVHRYMSILNISSKRKKKYISQKVSVNVPIHRFPNILEQDFDTIKPHKWLTDITYLPCKDGTLYLSCIKDMQDKSIVAHSISIKNDLRLVLETLDKAQSKMSVGILLHSDQGSQYCSHRYHKYLNRFGLIGSMSRKGTPYDNAPMESFFSTLKNEELKLYRNRSMSQTRKIVKNFIHYYNNNRPQWALKKMTPVEFRSHL